MDKTKGDAMSHTCKLCLTEATSDEDVYVDVEYSDDGMWHQSEPGSHNQQSAIVCGACLNANWVAWRLKLISLRRIRRPLGSTA